MRDDLLERRSASRAKSYQQRAVEPATVLIRPLEIEGWRPSQLGVVTEDAFMARPRVEPNVEDVLLTLERLLPARRAQKVSWYKLAEVAFVPGVGPVLFKHRGRLLGK